MTSAHHRRRRPRSTGLASIALVALLGGGWLLAACVAPDQEAARLPSQPAAEQTLPSITTTTAAAADAEPDREEPVSTAPPPTLSPLRGLEAELVASGFDQPILVTGAPGTEALYVVEREGVIRVIEDRSQRPVVVADEPFLDLSDRVGSNSIEQGLLGLAFPPDHGQTGLLYAYWTDPTGDSRLGRFAVDSSLRADPDSLEVLLEVPQPAERHNAGMLQFGPDGLLYVALGDGGSGGSTAQDTSNLLGSILRIDVSPPSSGTAGGDGRPYAIPAGNPFGDEIWVYGLRNPWRFSIDPATERIFIGDVGQSDWEEVNVVGLDGAGTNFGWRPMEGDRCFEADCDRDGLTLPVLQYGHDQGCSITGGHVYRGGAIPELDGHYFFADWCGELVQSFRLTPSGQVTESLDWSTDLAAVGQVTSFGTDGDDELYTVNWDGELHRIVPIR